METPQTPFQAWAQAWQGATPLAGLPAAAPLAMARTLWIDLPVEVATRLQRFAANQAQEQIRMLSATPAEGGSGNPMLRQMAFLQQSSLAWGTELMEIAELYQEKLLNPGRAPSDAPVHYPKAA